MDVLKTGILLGGCLTVKNQWELRAGDDRVGFEFSVDIDPDKLDERKTEIEEDFVGNIGKEIGKKMKRTKPRNPGYNC